MYCNPKFEGFVEGKKLKVGALNLEVDLRKMVTNLN